MTKEGALVQITDLNQGRLDDVSAKYGATIFTGADLYSADVDIYSPCALGATVTDETINKLKAKVIAGAANNQLANDAVHGQILKDKGIVYATDFLINAGVIINVCEIKEFYGKIAIYDGATDQPITAAPVLYRIDDNNFVVIFGTGSDVYSVDRTTINRQIVMGIHDDLTNTNPTTLQPGDRNIIDQSITLGTDGYRYLSTNTFTTGTSRAWRILLDPGVQVSVDNVTSSERVVSKPQLLTRTVFFTTRIYEFQKTSTSLPSGADPANTCYSTSANVSTGGTSWQMAVDAETGSGPMAGESADKTLGSYFEFSDALAPTVGAGQSRPVLAGVNLGYLSSAPALVNTSASSGEHLQTNAHGELGYSGEIVSAFDRSPNQLTGTNNPLDTLNPTCISKNEAYSLLIARGGTNAGEQHNLTELKLISPICPDPLNQGKTLIRVDWRQVPL